MILKGSVFHCNTGRTRGLWWASPSLGRHSGCGQAGEGFYNVGAVLFLFFIYIDFQYIGGLWGGVHIYLELGFIVWSDCVLVIVLQHEGTSELTLVMMIIHWRASSFLLAFVIYNEQIYDNENVLRFAFSVISFFISRSISNSSPVSFMRLPDIASA
jgi:hypothetical protein